MHRIPVVGLCFAFVSALAADAFKIQRWHSDNGLGENAVQAITQARDGCMWFGTHNGVIRFDGFRFQRFTSANTPALRDGATSFAETSDGALWMGTKSGLLRYQYGEFTGFHTNNGLLEDDVWDLCVGNDDALWIRTKNTVTVRRGNKFTAFTTNHGIAHSNVLSLTKLDERIIAGSYPGLQPFDERTQKFLPPDLSLTPSGVFTRLARGGRGELWGGDKFGLHVRRGSEWTTVRGKTWTDGTDYIRCWFTDATGALWCSVPEQGLMRWTERGEEPVRLLEGTPPQVRAVFQDRQGAVWVGTSHDGVFRVAPARISVITATNGLPSDRVLRVAAQRDIVWVGTSDGFARIVSNRCERVEVLGRPTDLAGTPKRTEVRALAFGGESMFISTGAGSLLEICGYDFSKWPRHERGEDLRANVLCFTRDGALWMGSSMLARFQAATNIWFRTANGIPGNTHAIYEDSRGRVWFGGEGGVFWCERDEIVFVKGLTNVHATCFFEAADGGIWLAAGAAVCRWRDSVATVLTRTNGLPDADFDNVIGDDLGNLWFGTANGIYRVALADGNALADGRATSVPFARYGEADGMLSTEVEGRSQQTVTRTPDGRLWFATGRGIAVVSPRELLNEEQRPLPAAMIEQISARGETLWHDGSTTASPLLRDGRSLTFAPRAAHSVTIQYTAPEFAGVAHMRFRYQFEGHDEHWVDAGAERAAHFTNLKPGRYVFRVRASDHRGLWNRTGAEVAFTIAPFFWQTLTFKFGGALAVFAVVFAVHRARVLRVRSMENLKRQHALELERARIAQDMHDDLGANLTKVAILSEVAKRELTNPAVAQRHVETISETARQAVDDITDIVWAINPRHDTLESLGAYLREYAAQFCEVVPLTCDLDFPKELPRLSLTAELRRNVFLTLKEALHNVAKHARAKHVRVQLRADDGELLLVIADDGVGLPGADERRARSDAPHRNGLANMRRRVEELGGTFDVRSSVGQGTTVEARLPLQKSEILNPES